MSQDLLLQMLKLFQLLQKLKNQTNRHNLTPRKRCQESVIKAKLSRKMLQKRKHPPKRIPPLKRIPFLKSRKILLPNLQSQFLWLNKNLRKKRLKKVNKTQNLQTNLKSKNHKPKLSPPIKRKRTKMMECWLARSFRRLTMEMVCASSTKVSTSRSLSL